MLLLAAALALLSLPTAVFLSNSRSLSWDLIGHVAEAEAYGKEGLAKIYGWNPYFLFGYPIHIYPPLSRVVLAAVGSLVGTALAAKAILAISCLAVLPSLFLFIKSRGYSGDQAGAAVLLVSLYMATFVQTEENYRGFTLYEAFYFGLFSEFFALPFYFLALAFYARKPALSAAFSSVVLLSNVLISVMLGMSVLALILAEINRRDWKKRLKESAVYAACVWLVCSFWLLPFAHQMLLPSSDAHVFRRLPLVLIAAPAIGGLLITSAVLYLLYFRGKQPGPGLPKLALFLALVAIGVYLPATAPGTTYLDFKLPLLALSGFSAVYLLSAWKDFLLKFYLLYVFLFFLMHAALPFAEQLGGAATMLLNHSYRFLAIVEVLYVATIAAGAWAALSWLGNKRATAIIFSALLLLAASYLFPAYFFRLYLHPDESSKTYDFSQANASGRALLYSSSDCLPAYSSCRPHSSYFQYFVQTGKPIAYGLFIEEAGLSEVATVFVAQTQRTGLLAWSIADYPNMTLYAGNYPKAARFYSELFWVTDLFVTPEANSSLNRSTEFLDSAFEYLGELNASSAVFRHYRLGNFSVAQAREMQAACRQDWTRFMHGWFELGETQLYFQSCGGEGDLRIPDNSSLVVLSYRGGQIELFANSTQKLPILVKEAYDPGWKAYENGRPVQLFRATPNLMAVYGKGKITLKYEPDYGPAPWLLSGIGLLVLAILHCKARNRST